MPRVDLTLGVDVERTARVKQIEGMFDVPEKKRVTLDLHMDVPLEEKPWQIGLIVGPSGAGKTTVARQLFGDSIVDGYEWHSSKSIIDSFGDVPIKEVASALSSVGFSSPPAWVKPFHVLSNGEKFRVTLARVLMDERPILAIDEFTSVVDRTVGRIGAHAAAKAIRSKANKQFVAITCHEDVLEWLQPDWVLEPHLSRFEWRFLRRRPTVECELVRVDREAWRWFAPHHYLSADLHRAARCFAALVEGKPAAFLATLHFPHPHERRFERGHRVVTLPDFQGIGVGVWLSDTIGSIATALGNRYCWTSSHPALIASAARSPHWKLRTYGLANNHQARSKRVGTGAKASVNRRTASFEYVGPKFQDEHLARKLWA